MQFPIHDGSGDVSSQTSAAQVVGDVGASVRDLVHDLVDAVADKPPKASAASTAQEEIRMVLTMLERGAITVDEAERLIAALRP